MRLRREKIINSTLDDRQVEFDDGSTWRLTEKICEKAWEGYQKGDRSDWDAYEAHAVFHCVQEKGLNPGKTAIMKARVEVPRILDRDESPADRAKHALGMRLGPETRREIEGLKRVTEAHCKMTPRLLGVKIEQQDETLSVRWWMPGGYVVYILMEKLPAVPLDYYYFWDLDATEREDIRKSFKEGLFELASNGLVPHDRRIDNLMWNHDEKRCYFIDFEDVRYGGDFDDSWYGGVYGDWSLWRTDEPQW